MQYGTLTGDAGVIEWMFEDTASSHCLVLCHPHPLYGGSMQDGVLECMARVAKNNDIASVRFNFRSVGASEGQHDQGRGEISDLAHVLQAFGGKFERVTLGGYSFGALVALNFTAETKSTYDLILVAPPTNQPLPNIGTKVSVIVGDVDPISQMQTLEDWTTGLSKHLYCIDDADHFLAAFDTDLEVAVSSALNT